MKRIFLLLMVMSGMQMVQAEKLTLEQRVQNLIKTGFGFTSSLVTIPALTVSGGAAFFTSQSEKELDILNWGALAAIALLVGVGSEKTSRDFAESISYEEDRKLSYALNRLGFTLGGLFSFAVVFKVLSENSECVECK